MRFVVQLKPCCLCLVVAVCPCPERGTLVPGAGDGMCRIGPHLLVLLSGKMGYRHEAEG